MGEVTHSMESHEILALQDALALESSQFRRKGRLMRRGLEDVSPLSLETLVVGYGIVFPITKEHRRLKTLHELDILDESGFPELDRLTAMATRIFNVENAEVALVDLRRVWCPSKVGQDDREYNRGDAIASIAIATSSSEAFLVLDASVDERVAHLNCVNQNDGIRFYAGVPLTGPNDQCIGIFSIHSSQSRVDGFSIEEVQTLSDLAATAMSFISCRRRLQAVREEQKQTVTRLAHDLLTPLTAIQLATQLLSSDEHNVNLNVKQKESLEALTTSVSVMERFCNSALGFLRWHESSYPEQEYIESNADMESDHLIYELQTMTRFIPKQVPVVLRIDPSLPRVLPNGAKIQQAALNFLTMACARTVQGKVTFRIRNEDQRVVFECSNTASHFSEADTERIMHVHDEAVAQNLFSASFRAGLDLRSGVRKNPSGTGSTFWFSVPKVASEKSSWNSLSSMESDDDDSMSPPTYSVASADDSSIDSKLPEVRWTALVVDDCLVVRKVLSRALGKIGFSVDVAENGQEGLSKLMLCTYDVCLCDFLMPILDGMDMVRQYRHWESVHRGSYRQKIVGMSAHASDSDSCKAIDVGMDSFMRKPISMELLKAMTECYHAVKRNWDETDCLIRMDDSTIPGDVPKGKRSKIDPFDDSASSLSIDAINIIEDSDLPVTSHSLYGCLVMSKTPIEECLFNSRAASNQTGWDFAYATTKEEALRSLKARNWDIVLVYGNISPMSGIDIVAEFRNWEVANRFNRQNNVLLVTPPPLLSDVDETALITPSGFDGSIRMPFDLHKLVHNVVVSSGENGAPMMSIITH